MTMYPQDEKNTIYEEAVKILDQESRLKQIDQVKKLIGEFHTVTQELREAQKRYHELYDAIEKAKLLL